MEDALLRVGLAPVAPVMSAAPRSPQRMATKDARAGGLHLLGLNGDALIAGAVDLQSGTRTLATDIHNYLLLLIP